MKRNLVSRSDFFLRAEVSEAKIILSPRWKSLANSIAHPSEFPGGARDLSAGMSGLIPEQRRSPESSGGARVRWRVRATASARVTLAHEGVQAPSEILRK